jgi:hypothetical protein
VTLFFEFLAEPTMWDGSEPQHGYSHRQKEIGRRINTLLD